MTTEEEVRVIPCEKGLTHPCCLKAGGRGSWEMWETLAAGKGKKTDSLLEPPEKKVAL